MKRGIISWLLKKKMVNRGKSRRGGSLAGPTSAHHRIGQLVNDTSIAIEESAKAHTHSLSYSRESCETEKNVSAAFHQPGQLDSVVLVLNHHTMETAIRWSPSSTTQDQRFLYVDVTGKSFKLCQVTSFDGKGLEYDVLSTHVRVPGFRAFDWSTADESLIAVGQSSGEVNILRMEGDSQESWSFPIRNQRYCNSVAFSSHGLLAGGLDKVRNDVCLNVWDVNHRIMTGNSRGGLAHDRQGAEPLRKLSSDPITSIKFYRDQPDTLVAGVKGQFLKLFDLRGAFHFIFLRYICMYVWSCTKRKSRQLFASFSFVPNQMRPQHRNRLAG
jgi:hypothetical protein